MVAGFEGWTSHHHIRINGEYKDIEDIQAEELYKIRRTLTERFAKSVGGEFVEEKEKG